MAQRSDNQAGILAIVIGMALISVNDSVVKGLSDSYPLHQIVFARAAIGGAILAVVVARMGGMAILRVTRPWLHILRAGLIVVANLTFFSGLVVMSLAQATALFFVAPLLITLLSVLFLGMPVGAHRITALVIGFAGVLVMLGPEALNPMGAGWAVVLPLVAALSYSGMQVLTRALGPSAHPAAMSFFVQLGFFLVCLAFWAVAGDGRFVQPDSHPSIHFLLRAWAWPEVADLPYFLAIGCIIAGVSWFMTQAYRLADPATVAPFEYIAMPLATLWGLVFFGEWPGPTLWAGMAMIAGAGLYIVWRERKMKIAQKMA